jgi:hypothetical protein
MVYVIYVQTITVLILLPQIIKKDIVVKMNPSEFERTKPTVTMKKINDLIKLIDEERVKTEILYKDRSRSLHDIKDLLLDMKDSFKKGE